MPSWRAGRKMGGAEIVILVTGVALHRRYSEANRAASNVHAVRMRVIALTRVIAFGMAIHAARMSQHRDEGGKQGAIVAGRSRARGLRSRSDYGMPQPRRGSQAGQYQTPKSEIQMLHAASDRRIGNLRIRLPVAANIALAIAGAAHGTPGSPIPPDFSWLSTM